MKILFILSLAFTLLCEAAHAQTFQKIIGGTETDYAQKIIAIDGNGYAISGTSEEGLILIRLDTEGDTIWTKTYFGSEALEGAWVKKIEDTGYILVGHGKNTNFGDELIFVIRVDEDGNMMWSKMYGSILNDDVSSVGVDIAPDGFYVAGYASTGANGDDCLLLKLNTEGELIWSHMFGGEEYDGLSEVMTTADGGCIAVGYSESFDFGLNSVFITQWTSDGVLEWAGTMNNGLDCYGSGISAVSDGYIISGASSGPGGLGTTYDALLIKLNMSLGVTWTKLYSGPYLDIMIAAIGLPSGGIVGAGYKSSTGDDASSFLLETNSFGEITWCKNYNEEQYNFATGLVRTENGFLLTGGVVNQPNGQDIFLVRTNISGISNCNDNLFEPIVSETELEVNSPLITSEDVIYTQAIEITMQPGTSVNVICEANQVAEHSASELEVFPNPFQNSFTISGTSRDGNVIIYDIVGNQVLAMGTQEEKTTIDTMSLGMGIYVVSYSDEWRTMSCQIMNVSGH